MVKLRKIGASFAATITQDVAKGMGWDKGKVEIMLVPDKANDQIIFKRIK